MGSSGLLLEHLSGYWESPYYVRHISSLRTSNSPVITGFRIGCEGLGNKQPRSGRERKPLCPVCPQVADNTGFHLFACTSISRKRAETGITSFITSCSFKGFSMQETYALFINGFDYSKKRLSYADYIERGKCMNDMKQEWLQKW